jgi:hypothetical protein
MIQPILLWAVLVLGTVLGTLAANGAAQSWSLVSPDSKHLIRVGLESGRLSYEVQHRGKVVLRPSPLGLVRDDQDFSRELSLAEAGQVRSEREDYELLAGPQPRVRHALNHRTLSFRNQRGSLLAIDLAASDEGVAFRYWFPETNRALRVVETERTGFVVPANAQGWLQPYHSAGQYTPAYEDFFFRVSAGEQPPDSRQKARGWAFPALFQLPDAGAWALLTESGTDEAYCGCHLTAETNQGLYRIAFALEDERTQGYTNQFGPEPRYTCPWTMPWRVVVVGESAGVIATETLVTDLAPACRIEDPSWIKPGRSSWAWWSYPDEPPTVKRFDEFTDFAAKMGWEYTLFDAGWWTPGLQPIVQHARAQAVKCMAWSYATDFYEPGARARKLDEFAAAGVCGVKADFWCSDRQETIAAQQALMRDAAARHMLVNLHGCTIPRGWHRTWPNLLTCEAVLGAESYFFEPRYTDKAAELDTVLPFTRNAIGPMDYTPIACSPKRYARTTTAAHQLAAALVFTSGIVHYADQPEFFNALPAEVIRLLRDAPARWDETVCLKGEPGRLAVFARRAGQSWFVAGISGSSEPQPVALDLAAFKKCPHRLMIVEGENPGLEVKVAPLSMSDSWQRLIPSRGGFILRLDP